MVVKILMVNKFLYPNGGSETYIFKLGEELQRQGHEVQYFGMEHEGRIVGNHAQVYTSNMDFHTGKLQKLLYPFRIIYSKEAYRKMQTVLHDFEPDVVHLNNINFQLTPSVIEAVRDWEKGKNKKINLIYTAHDSQLVCPNHLMQQFLSGVKCQECLEKDTWQCVKHKCIHGSTVKSLLGSVEAAYYKHKHTYRKIDHIVCPSKFIKECLDYNADLKGRTKVLHNFVSMVNAEKKEVNAVEEKYVLYFGRYSPEKGVNTLIEVCKRTPHIHYKFAGSGPLKEQVCQLENVEELGFLKSENLSQVIREAQFVIFPSECYENCPFSVLEAQMCGTPVIATDLGGTPELINNGVSGVLFEPGNVDSLLKCVNRLWNDEAVVRRLSHGCLQQSYMGVEEYTEQLMKIYEECR